MRPSGGSDIDGIPEDGLIILLFAALVLYRTLQFEKVVDDDPSPNYDASYYLNDPMSPSLTMTLAPRLRRVLRYRGFGKAGP
jgi:hypothetical protein